MKYMFTFVLCMLSIIFIAKGVTTEGFNWYSVAGGAGFGWWYAIMFGGKDDDTLPGGW